jgi:hypothetical protein
VADIQYCTKLCLRSESVVTRTRRRAYTRQPPAALPRHERSGFILRCIIAANSRTLSSYLVLVFSKRLLPADSGTPQRNDFKANSDAITQSSAKADVSSYFTVRSVWKGHDVFRDVNTQFVPHRRHITSPL